LLVGDMDLRLFGQEIGHVRVHQQADARKYGYGRDDCDYVLTNELHQKELCSNQACPCNGAAHNFAL